MIIKEGLDIILDEAEKVAQLFRDILAIESEIDRDKEHFWVIGLDVKNRVIFVELCTLGILDRNLVHPREVFRLAISRGVARIIVGHNHPSNDPEPSKEDIAVTEKLAKEIVSLPLYPELTELEIDYIIKTVTDIYQQLS